MANFVVIEGKHVGNDPTGSGREVAWYANEIAQDNAIDLTTQNHKGKGIAKFTATAQGPSPGHGPKTPTQTAS